MTIPEFAFWCIDMIAYVLVGTTMLLTGVTLLAVLFWTFIRMLESYGRKRGFWPKE